MTNGSLDNSKRRVAKKRPRAEIASVTLSAESRISWEYLAAWSDDYLNAQRSNQGNYPTVYKSVDRPSLSGAPRITFLASRYSHEPS